ncbi:PC-esterase domain-containing protein 1A [Hyalella azteca]|uniref:PC-esterase domain-containing protein 1A n=1 Tax=Hyalella azteca TaxID=294128 RepID=A0A8B7P536_HYAAZ|nr:PC-esterase domain-containing protein 1A [Hyalella azteca]
MADIFCKKDALQLLQNRFILIIGDSNTRALYNDLIYLLHENDVTSPAVFRKHSNKNVKVKEVDKVVKQNDVRNATRNLQEIREYWGANGVRVRFCFVTRVMGQQMLWQLNEMERGDIPCPDIILLNSCVWDITRWGAMMEDTYKQQLVQVFTRLRQLVHPDTLVMWATTLPVAENLVRGGLLIKQLDFIQKNIRFMALEANLFVSELCKLFCFDIVDLHYHMRFQLSR